MAKNHLCKDCTHNNNGWCNIRKTNQGLKDLPSCEFKEGSGIARVIAYLENKRMEYEINPTPLNEGIVQGLELAIAMMKQ